VKGNDVNLRAEILLNQSKTKSCRTIKTAADGRGVCFVRLELLDRRGVMAEAGIFLERQTLTTDDGELPD